MPFCSHFLSTCVCTYVYAPQNFTLLNAICTLYRRCIAFAIDPFPDEVWYILQVVVSTTWNNWYVMFTKSLRKVVVQLRLWIVSRCMAPKFLIILPSTLDLRQEYRSKMIGLHYYYFFVTFIHFVKRSNAFPPPSLDKKDILEPAAQPLSGSSDTTVGSENQDLKVHIH